MLHELDPVFVMDIAIFGSSVAEYAVLSVIGLSVICAFEHVPDFAAGAAVEEA
jgi:hypothetical protein